MTDPALPPCCTVERIGHVVVLDIQRALRMEQLESVATAVAVIEREGALPEILVRVAAGVGFPTTEARAGFVTHLRALRDRVRAVHVLLEGHGFWAATMTALVATVTRAVPYGPKVLVHTRLDDALALVEGGRSLQVSGVFERAGLRERLAQRLSA